LKANKALHRTAIPLRSIVTVSFNVRCKEMIMENEIDIIFSKIKKQLSELPEGSNIKNDLISHLRSLARWYNEPMDYPEASNIDFPDTLDIAYAVCHPECGAKEFIVDGNTQECQKCGSLMFRTDVRSYKQISESSEPVAGEGRS
jgi:hypothetical protein